MGSKPQTRRPIDTPEDYKPAYEHKKKEVERLVRQLGMERERANTAVNRILALEREVKDLKRQLGIN